MARLRVKLNCSVRALVFRRTHEGGSKSQKYVRSAAATSSAQTLFKPQRTSIYTTLTDTALEEVVLWSCEGFC